MQGKKGIGRYAASILGSDLLLETVTTDGEKTVVYTIWKDFEEAAFLDEVPILVESTRSNESKGTSLTINCDTEEDISYWDNDQFKALRFELKKLISPFEDEIVDSDDEQSFKILLEFDGIQNDLDGSVLEEIKPFPVFDLYDYRISGKIKEDGTGKLAYISQKARNTIEESIEIDLDSPTECGELRLDIRVYDREKEAIEQIIERGLKDDHDEYVGNLAARQILNEYNGIGVFRNGFRIRPLGDAGYDWLALNKRRVQIPTKRIGSNQVIGYVEIQSEDVSMLQEKSARDGLRENRAFQKLKDITIEVIGELEKRRFSYRYMAGLSRSTSKVEGEIQQLLSFESLKKDVRGKLKKAGADEVLYAEIEETIAKQEEKAVERLERIRNTIAIYQGQATLGKIINVVLHEGRRPLNYFKNQIPNLEFWAKDIKNDFSHDTLSEIVKNTEGLGRNAIVFVNLFERLDPLAARKRKKKEIFSVNKAVIRSFDVFENELILNGVSFRIDCEEDIKFEGWQQDLYVIMTNLIDNSIYWLTAKKNKDKKIFVKIKFVDGSLAYVDYKDTGPGIEKHLIESQVIFEPEFSTKPDGIGLGLAIAGEAASRLGLNLKVFESNSGAYFRLQPKNEDEQTDAAI